jgi:glutamate-1-semialdehyde 2,1-aminomutase
MRDGVGTDATIPRDTYLAEALRLAKDEIARRDALLSRLPDEVIDAHVHTCRKQDVLSVPEPIRRHVMSTFPWFDLEDSAAVDRVLFGGRTVRRLRFPHVFKGVRSAAANEYLQRCAPSIDRLAWFGQADDLPGTSAGLHQSRTVALKMYHRAQWPPAQTIYETFPPEILEAAQEQGLPIVLHLPTPLPASSSELDRLVADFPRLPIVLAHLGVVEKYTPGLEDVYGRLARYETIWMDTAMITDRRVIEAALSALGPERILFGSDEPLSLIRAYPVVAADGTPRLVSHFPYHWTDTDEKDRRASQPGRAPLLLWLQLEALLDMLPDDASVVRVFGANAGELYRFGAVPSSTGTAD